MRVPFFAIFIPATFLIWLLLLIPFLVPMAYAILSKSILLNLVILPLTIVLNVILFLWLARWYFICVGLMFGRPDMACTKATDVAQSIASLEATMHKA